MQNYPFYEEVLFLTKKLVSIPSMNNTQGEREVAEHMAQWLRDLPYFSGPTDRAAPEG